MTLAEQWFKTMTREFPGSFSIQRGKETLLAETPALIKRLDVSLLSTGNVEFITKGKTLITLAKYLGAYVWKIGDAFCIADELYEAANDQPQTQGSWNGEVIIFHLKRIGKK